MSATAKLDKVSQHYALQACINLEQLFTALNDLEAVRHYQQRQQQIAQQIENRKSQIVNQK